MSAQNLFSKFSLRRSLEDTHIEIQSSSFTTRRLTSCLAIRDVKVLGGINTGNFSGILKVCISVLQALPTEILAQEQARIQGQIKTTNYSARLQNVKSLENPRGFCSNVTPIFEQDQPMQIATDFTSCSLPHAPNTSVSTRSSPAVPQGLSLVRRNAPCSSI